MKTVSVNQIHATIGAKFATIQGYPKKDGTLSNINFSMGVHVRTNGGKWNGDTTKHVLVHKPAHPKNTNASYNGYRTLLKDSLIGCTLKANGQEYKIVK